MNEEMNFEHLSNDTFPESGGFSAGYEKPAWKMNSDEVEKELMVIKNKELKNESLDEVELAKKQSLLKRKIDFS